MSKETELYFKQKLLVWHRRSNKRELPWKGEKDVYKIWLSEIILQQTRAGQGWKYYELFVNKYPSVQKLAKAPLEEVYKLWEGLGYYNRCKNLHATAREIVFENSGVFPSNYDALLKLKGVGPYTAAAIASFAFNLPHAVVDGNVFRVLSRFFGIHEPIDSGKGKKLFADLAQNCLDYRQPALYNQAIMDFGATVCKPELPLCQECIFKKKCKAFLESKTSEFPVKEKTVKQRNRWFRYLIIDQNGKIAVEKRTAKDIWFHLYQFPVQEFSSQKEWNQKRNKSGVLKHEFLDKRYRVSGYSRNFSQKLSHQTIHAYAVLLQVDDAESEWPAHWQWKTEPQLKKLTFPGIIHELLKDQKLSLFKKVT
jgi:A/G-specific adenine glycosylase